MTVESQFISAKQSFRSTHGKKNKTKQNAKQKIPTKTVNAIRQPCLLQSGTTRGGTAGSCTFFLQPLLKMPWKSAAGCTAIPRNRVSSGLFPPGCWDFISAWDSKLLPRRELKPLVIQTHSRDKGKGAFESLWGAGERAQWVRAPPAKLEDPSTAPESYMVEGHCHLPQVVP